MNNIRNVSSEEEMEFEKRLNIYNKKHHTKLTKLRCAIYARKSQEDSFKTSLPAQIQYCENIIKSSKFLEEKAVYQEDDVSGMWDQRTQFQEMFNQIQNNEFDVIVCMRWDRISRKTSDLGHYNELALQNGVYILAGDEDQVVNNASRNFCRGIKWATNELYARDMAERTMNAVLNTAKNGKFVSGNVPYGYDYKDKKVVLNIEEAVNVISIFDKYLARRISGLYYKGIE